MADDLGHAGINYFLTQAVNSTSYSVSNPSAVERITCGHCGLPVAAAVLASTKAAPSVVWLRCTGCGLGSVENEGVLTPGPKPGQDVQGLPDNVAAAYREARASAAVAAWTGVEMLCRKILMHVAVDKGAKEGGTFVTYLDYLEKEGYVPPVMRPWVDLIRKHGNEATHELPAIDAERGAGTFVFTEQLLKTTYEMAALAAKFAPTAGAS